MRSSITSRRYRNGWMSRTKERRSAGKALRSYRQLLWVSERAEIELSNPRENCKPLRVVLPSGVSAFAIKASVSGVHETIEPRDAMNEIRLQLRSYPGKPDDLLQS